MNTIINIYEIIMNTIINIYEIIMNICEIIMNIY